MNENRKIVTSRNYTQARNKYLKVEQILFFLKAVHCLHSLKLTKMNENKNFKLV